MKINKNNKISSEKGNALLLTVILVLTMFVLIGAMTKLSVMQYDVSTVQRNTSNTYDLAEAGVQEMLYSMNNYLENIPNEILQELTNGGATSPFRRAVFAGGTSSLTDNVIYKNSIDGSKEDYNGVFVLEDRIPGNFGYIIEKYYTALKKNYYDDYNDPVNEKPKTFIQHFKGDREKKDMKTEVTVRVYFDRLNNGTWAELPDGYNQSNLLSQDDVKLLGRAYAGDTTVDPADVDKAEKKDFCVIVSEAKTYDPNLAVPIISDSQKVIATITLDDIEKTYYEIQERYKWTHRPTEALDNAIVCFSDILATQGGKLEVIDGDVVVKGSKKEANPLEVLNYQFPEPDQSGGVLATEGGQITVTRGNLYCTSNVATTNGWDRPNPDTAAMSAGSQIQVEGDIIADTVGIYDRISPGYGNPVKSNNIVVGKNIFVDNDVRIDNEVADSHIKVGNGVTDGMIFGVSDQDSATRPDPNKSSGVFNRGGSNTKIEANGAYVLGQPFINFSGDPKYYRLNESIGEPYEINLQGKKTTGYTLDDYIIGNEGNIKQDKIILKDSKRIYAPQKVSAEIEGITSIGDFKTPTTSSGDSINEGIVKQMLYEGWKSTDNIPRRLKDLVGHDDYKLGYITNIYDASPAHYYKGSPNPTDDKGIYYKDFIKEVTLPQKVPTNKYQGLLAYMTAMRSVFYKGFNDAGDLVPVKFENVINTGVFGAGATWSKENPVCVTNDAEVDLKDYYAVSNVVVCTNSNVTLKATNFGNNFNGIIICEDNVTISSNVNIKGIVICEDNVTISSDVNIKGILIVGGNTYDSNVRDAILKGGAAGLKVGSGGNLTVEYDPDALWKLQFEDKSLFRQVLAVFRLANFSQANPKANELVDLSTQPSNLPTYTIPKITFSEDIVPQIRHSGVNLRITSIKSVKK